MTKFFDIAVKNIKTLFRDKRGLLFLILIPILFYSIMGLIFGGTDSTATTYTYQIGWVDEDSSESGSPYKTLDNIYSNIDELDAFELHNFSSSAAALEDLTNKRIDAYIIFPQGYELYLNGSEAHPPENVSIYYRDSTSEITRNIIYSTITSILYNVVNYHPSNVKIFFEERTITGKETSNLTSGTPGYLMYGILSSLSGGVILITQERKEGLLKRLESSQMRSSDMILGHLCSNTLVVLLQFVIGIITLSLFGFSPAFHDIFSLIVGVLLTVVLLSFFQNALALVASTILKTPEAAGGGVWIVLIPLMTFSGAFFPLELVAPSLIPYVGWIPTRIAVVLFQDLMVNAVALTSAALWLQFLWLGLEGIALFLIAIRLYRKFAQSQG